MGGRCGDFSCDSDSDCDVLAEACVDGNCTATSCNEQTFVLETQTNYDRVFLTGSFSDWEPMAHAMEQLDDGRWFLRLELPDGRWTYKFVAYELDSDDPIWISDPANADSEPDGVGGNNSIRMVSCRADTLPKPGICGDVTAFEWRDTVM